MSTYAADRVVRGGIKGILIKIGFIKTRKYTSHIFSEVVGTEY